MNSLEKLKSNLSIIQKRLGYEFLDQSLLELAFVHRSFVNENRDLIDQHNERLEFLGDAALGLIVSEYLFVKHPELPEGDLSFLRSRLVEAPSCLNFAEEINIGEFLLLGKGEAANVGKGRCTILADLFEAIMGAIYVDTGLIAAKDFFFRHFEKSVEEILKEPMQNWKAELQDYSQKLIHEPPRYEVSHMEGPDHAKTFHVTVFIGDQKMGEGVGSSKKEAEQNAAQQALLTIEKNG